MGNVARGARPQKLNLASYPSVDQFYILNHQACCWFLFTASVRESNVLRQVGSADGLLAMPHNSKPLAALMSVLSVIPCEDQQVQNARERSDNRWI